MGRQVRSSPLGVIFPYDTLMFTPSPPSLRPGHSRPLASARRGRKPPPFLQPLAAHRLQGTTGENLREYFRRGNARALRAANIPVRPVFKARAREAGRA